MTKKDYTTISVDRKDKKRFQKLCIDHDLKQEELFRKLINITKQFKPELKDGK